MPFTILVSSSLLFTPVKGVFPPEALDAPTRAYYLAEAAKFELSVDEVVQRRLF